MSRRTIRERENVAHLLYFVKKTELKYADISGYADVNVLETYIYAAMTITDYSLLHG